MTKLIKVSIVVFIFALVVPIQTKAQTGHDSRGTNVNIDGTIWYITDQNCKTAYTSAGAYLSYGFTFNQVASATESDLDLPSCDENNASLINMYGKFLAPQYGKIVCSDRGADKGTCYVMGHKSKYGFTNASAFLGQGYSFSNTVEADISWIPMVGVISDKNQAHIAGPINYDGQIGHPVNDSIMLFASMESLNSYGYTLNDVVTANTEDWKTFNGFNFKIAASSRFKGKLNLLY